MVTSLQIPLLLGGQWGKFYFLTGAKFDYALYTINHLKADQETIKGSITYQKRDSTISFKPNLMVSAELGFRLGDVFEETGFDVPNPIAQYRLALFADVGVLPINKEAQNSLIENGNVMSCRETKDAKFKSFMVGIKFTVLFRLPKKKVCLSCMDQPFRSSHGILE